MSVSSRYLAVIPAYNESATIADVVTSIHRHQPLFDVLVVDDGSLDDTHVAAEVAGARVVRHPFNLGIGGAVQSGFVYALEQGYDYLVQVDADGQHDPAEIARLLDTMDEEGPVDVVCGSRFLGEDMSYPAPVSRRAGIHIFATLLSRLVDGRVTDPTSGFRLYNRRAITLFARDYPHDFPEVEAVLMLHHHRLTMRETPVRMYARGGGASSITGSGKSAYYMVKVLLALFVGLARRRPLPRAEHGLMDDRIQVLSIVGASGLLLVVLELVRRRSLHERYALLWLASGVFLLVLAIWRSLLERVSDLIGIAYPPNALFFLAFAAILVLLLHFSAAVSRLADQTKVLAQRLALVEERLARQEARPAADEETDDDLFVGSGRGGVD